MDVSVLVEFFKQLSSLHLPAPIYGGYLVSRVIFGLFKTVDFDLEKVKELLAKLGVNVRDRLVPIMVEKAKEGIESLFEWLRGQEEEVEVNEATAEILVSQTQAAGDALDEAEIGDDKREETAQQVQQSLEALGGAHTQIAEAYAQALLNPDMREVLMAKMAGGLQTWQSQSMEARRNSLIAHSEQIMESDLPAEQHMVAEDDGVIIGGVQRISRANSEEVESE